MRLLLWSAFVFSAWKWGDWRNWKKYEGAIYYNAIFSFIYTMLTFDYPMWQFEKDASIPFLSNHILISIGYAFIVFPSTILIYLGRYPKGFWKATSWYLFFCALLTYMEIMIVKRGLLTYHHGWTTLDTILFNLLMFGFIRLYQSKPLITLLLSIIVSIAYCYIYKIPVHKLP